MQHHSSLNTSTEIRAMLRALALVPTMTIDDDVEAGTIIVTHSSGTVVFRAIQKHDGGPWIVRHVANLFA